MQSFGSVHPLCYFSSTSLAHMSTHLKEKVLFILKEVQEVHELETIQSHSQKQPHYSLPVKATPVFQGWPRGGDEDLPVAWHPPLRVAVVAPGPSTW